MAQYVLQLTGWEVLKNWQMEISIKLKKKKNGIIKELKRSQ